MSAIKILALGPNPALQRVLSFDTPLSIGGVNRATAADCYVGKGQGMLCSAAVVAWIQCCGALSWRRQWSFRRIVACTRWS